METTFDDRSNNEFNSLKPDPSIKKIKQQIINCEQLFHISINKSR